MIDYKKLKVIHDKLIADNNLYVEVILGEKAGMCVSLKDYKTNDTIFMGFTIDEVFQEFERLTNTESKYKTAWYMHNGQIKSTEVLNQGGYLFCDKSDYQSMGRTMYPTREALIESQISLWNNLKKEINDNIENMCEKDFRHESDGDFYHKPQNGEPWRIIRASVSSNPVSKCKKCGIYFK